MWDSGIGRVGGQQTFSVIDVWVVLQAYIFFLKCLMSVEHVLGSNGTKGSRKKAEVKGPHRDCAQSKAAKLGKI